MPLAFCATHSSCCSDTCALHFIAQQGAVVLYGRCFTDAWCCETWVLQTSCSKTVQTGSGVSKLLDDAVLLLGAMSMRVYMCIMLIQSSPVMTIDVWMCMMQIYKHLHELKALHDDAEKRFWVLSS